MKVVVPDASVLLKWVVPTAEEGRASAIELREAAIGGEIALVVPPWEPGHYAIRWDPVIEHVAWFSTQGWTGPETEFDVHFMPGTNAETVQLVKYLQISHRIPGWFRQEEAEALARSSYSLPEGAVIVEIGLFWDRARYFSPGRGS